MFSYELQEDNGIVVLKSVGTNTIEDYQDVAPQFFSDVKSRNIRRVLMDWRAFQGWESAEAPNVAFFSWIEARPLFDRVAIVFHDGIRNEVEKFEEFFRNADKEINKFGPERYDAALEWLEA